MLPPAPKRKKRHLLLLCDILFLILDILWCDYFALTYKSPKPDSQEFPSSVIIDEKRNAKPFVLLIGIPKEETTDTINN
ncbi:MAG: hypothetical protein K2M10_09585, partial [Muribaculaceae bacterium]|nr:hypothetical protein [Muribaculaceae bacterium]